MRKRNAPLTAVNHTSEYRSWGLNKLEEARNEYEREVADMSRQFGDIHFITLVLYGTFANLLDELEEFGKSKDLRMRIKDQIAERDGIGHPYYINSVMNVAKSHTMLGEWMEAQVLQEEALTHMKRSTEAPSSAELFATMYDLILTYLSRGRLKQAEELSVLLIEKFEKEFGREHPNTLASISNLAVIYSDQGRWEKAELLELQVIDLNKRVLGPEHLNTLISIVVLASIYKIQGRKKEAEQLLVQVISTLKRVFGQEHTYTLNTIDLLAITYQDQGRWAEAEVLLAQVLETTSMAFGQLHPNTLLRMNNLASYICTKNDGRRLRSY